MFSVYLPLCDCHVSGLLLVGLGAVVGLLGGFFGVGGGWIVTPALNILGMPMPYAVGTGLGYVFGMALVSGWRHRSHGNMEVRLGLGIGIPMVAGVRIGKVAVSWLERQGDADTVIRMVYITFLIGLGAVMVWDYWRKTRRRSRNAPDSGEKNAKPAMFLRVQWPPVIGLPRSGVRISLWVLVGAGLFTGTLAGILGVGGGFLLMPMMAYMMGVPTIVAVGTSLLCLLVSSPFAVMIYCGIPEFARTVLHDSGLTGFLDPHGVWQALTAAVRESGRVEFGAAGLMILGAIVGAPFGVAAGERVHGRVLRLLYAVMIILGGVSVALKQAGLGGLAKGLILGVAAGMSLLILALMLRAILRERSARARKRMRG